MKFLELHQLEPLVDAFLRDHLAVHKDLAPQVTEAYRTLIKDAILGLLTNPVWETAWGFHVGRRLRSEAVVSGLQEEVRALQAENARLEQVVRDVAAVRCASERARLAAQKVG